MDKRFLIRAWVKELKQIGKVRSMDIGDGCLDVIINGETLIYSLDEVTLMQCTGLSAAKSYRGDKPEDLLVYEGDILACGEGKVPTSIVWNDESHAFYAYNLKRKEYHRLDKLFKRFLGEIIGTIYIDG